MPGLLDHFDALTSRGLKVIPLRENSKVPLCRRWTQDWNREESRAKLQMFPQANIGLLLGDIVDVEGDSEQANRIVVDLIGDYPHPAYTSTKSIHHLFLTPEPTLRIFKVGDIEFRGHGHQSVLPPSSHFGTAYKWLKSFQFPVPEMPEPLLAFYRKHKLGRSIKPGHMEVPCAQCGKKCFLHHKRFDLELEAFHLLGSRWLCQSCRPIDLRPACRLLRRGVSGDQVRINALERF